MLQNILKSSQLYESSSFLGIKAINGKVVKVYKRGAIKLMKELNLLKRDFNNGNGQWQHFIKSIKINNIHGWKNQEIEFAFPIVAIVGENGIGKSTFLKASVCAYNNRNGKNFYPSKMFLKTPWDETGLEGATIEYKVKIGKEERKLRWRKTKDWGYAPKQNKPERHVFFLDISRTLPLDATAGYAKVAMYSNSEVETKTILTDESIRDLSYVLGQHYTRGRFTNTNVDRDREVGLLTKECGEISQFHQGAGEDAILDMFRLLQDIPEQSLLVIDEVENSLHPQAQRRFVQHLIKCARKKKLQIILSTHSPFVLDELPDISKIMLYSTSKGKGVFYRASTSFALSYIDEKLAPEIFVHVEDKEAIGIFWGLLKVKDDLYEKYSRILSVKDVGSYSIIKTLNELSEKRRLPYKSISIVDGDKRDECPNCIAFPGTLAPERMVFGDLKKIGWGKLDERFGIGAGSLFKYLDDAMLLPDHHKWTEEVGDKIKESKDVVWRIMIDEWVKQCISEEDISNFIDSIEEKVNFLDDMK